MLNVAVSEVHVYVDNKSFPCVLCVMHQRSFVHHGIHQGDLDQLKKRERCTSANRIGQFKMEAS